MTLLFSYLRSMPDPIILKVKFGADQAPYIDKLIMMFLAEDRIESFRHSPDNPAAFELHFATVYDVYLFGHAQANMGRDILRNPLGFPDL